ncbi:glycosyltransferase family 2 protein [Rossellomorea marisflavi]|uniref:Glycosyltransferase 2-like domain-containing protein n=1 Tax=Rossellomorea marisflavi TaxID=189381 RepID=A0A165INX4_9BACI|nr:glycosyltransferase [Rossellomorea marisflavi]KZE43902.1 hypothetical protein AV649_08650 [Rossellomorea marisflavi]
MPEISVIMGVYNTNNETIVLESINSILNQTFSDIELIICDDGSTDGTFELLQNISRSDKRIKLVKNETNLGLAATLNHCIRISNADLIARMDADDIADPNRLAIQLKFIKQNPQYALVGCNSILFDETGEWGYREMPQKPQNKDFLFRSPFIHPSILIYKSALLAVNNYRVNKETLRCEDYDLFMRLYVEGYKGYNIQSPLMKFRENRDAYSRRKYKYRIDEAKVRQKGFKSLGLMPKGFLYVVKPLIVGMLPQRFLAILRREKSSVKE